jgi:hypothetical protein
VETKLISLGFLFCRSLQMYVLGILETEDIIPKAIGGTGEKENL